ncbi:encapsidation protein 22 k [Aviadenovirus phalacrocoracidae]|uniref:Encapsidation protein 22 k n=1 Tax=Aviadenovirus sp. TaxID=2217649 RepID=A0ABZ0T1J3_9ADEN|nr:encapsidation protein 22 k [Aviadenovirus sp.]
MAQRMLDEKTRAVELQNQTAENVFPQRSEGESEEDVDGESLGSRDTETESETEEEEYSDALPPPPKSVPRPKSTRGSNRKRAVGKGASKADEKPAAKRRGNYRSWVRYRVAIHQALRDAVFDRRKASQLLKTAHKIFVPSSVLGYYARKLSASFLSSSDASSFSENREKSRTYRNSLPKKRHT